MRQTVVMPQTVKKRQQQSGTSEIQQISLIKQETAEATAEVAKAVRVAEAAQSFQSWQLVIKLIRDAEKSSVTSSKACGCAGGGPGFNRRVASCCMFVT